MNERQPKVSVCICAYKHGKYIAQAIESALMQKTDFEYEIIIGEDDSPDDTRKIVLEYQEKHPEKIRVLLQDRKNVVYINGVPTGRYNAITTLQAAKGKYIAYLDGDDYWTSSDKLQIQSDFMDGLDDCVFSFHGMEVVCETEVPSSKIPRTYEKGTMLTDRDWLTESTACTCTLMFRRSNFDTIPDWIWKVFMGDLGLCMLSLQFGKAYYIDKKMSAYRIHPGGIWSTKNDEFWFKCQVDFVHLLVEAYPGKYEDKVWPRLYKKHIRFARKHRDAGNYKLFFKYLYQSLSYWRYASEWRLQPLYLLAGMILWKIPGTKVIRSALRKLRNQFITRSQQN